jgi:hypothetical protein
MATTPPASGGGQYLDFIRAFTFVTEDPDWIKKILLGGLFTLLGGLCLIGTPFVAGYGLRVIGRTARGEARPLPEWDDWGGLFMDGLKAVGLYLVCLLALLVPIGGLGCALAFMAGGLSKGSEGAAAGVMGIGIVGLVCLGLVLVLILLLYLPAAFIRLAISGRFGVVFEFGENLALVKRNLGNYGLALGVYLVASNAASLGIVLCFVGVLVTSFWAQCSFAWALGEVARGDSLLSGASSAPIATTY